MSFQLGRLVLQVFLLGSTFSLIACSDSSGSGDGQNYYYEYPTQVDAEREVKNWRVGCRSSSQCPNTVAQLMVIYGQKVGVCTATLISNNTVLTNSHCFNSDESSMDINTLCKKNSFLIFPDNSPSGRQIVRCESVVAKSKISTKSKDFRDPDYMILKLKTSLNRGFDKFDSRGMEDGLKVQIRKINPVYSGYGELIVESCETTHGTFLSPHAVSPESPVHVLRGCEVVQGNSGSSLVDTYGQIRGVIFAALDAEKIPRSSSEGVTQQWIDAIKRARPSWATNGACIAELRHDSMPSRCVEERHLTENPFDKELPGKQGFIEGLDKEERQLANHPGYKFAFKDLSQSSSRSNTPKTKVEIVFYPDCAKDKSLFDRNSRTYELTLPIIKWTADTVITDKLVPQVASRRDAKSCLFSVRTITSQYLELYNYQPECQIERQPSYDYSSRYYYGSVAPSKVVLKRCE